MDALTGRQQTTRGIWLARSPKVAAPTTLVMDLEGSDGRERGEDDTSFERQSALFALATADILLINMWAKDVGREAGAGKPLLKTIFQVNLKLFQPSPSARRTVLLFVLRDRTKTPLEKLKETWEADLNRMWATIAKPAAYENSQISDFFEIQYAALSNYEDRTDEFMAESTLLRRRFTDDADDNEGLLRQSPHKLPGQALALSMSKVWEVIHENKDLNLPAHRVMVANIRCDEIAADQAAAFESNSTWQSLAADAQDDLVPSFGTKAAALLDAALAAYDEEARYFDAGVSAAKQEALVEQLQNFVKPAFDTQMALACGIAMDSFRLGMSAPSSGSLKGDTTPTIGKNTTTFVERAAACTAAALSEFDAAAAEIVVPGTEWTAASTRESLHRELAAHQAALRAEHVAAVLDQARETVQGGVSAGAMPLLESPPVDLWPRLGAVFDRESKSSATVLAKSLQGYGIDAAEEGELRSQVRAAAKSRLLANAKEAANTALPRLKDRFSETFQKDDQGMPRTWAPAVDIPAVAGESRRAAALLLSQLCVVRLGTSNTTGGTVPATASKVLITPTGTAKSVDVVDTAIMRLAEFSTSKQSGITAAAAAAAAASSDDTATSHYATDFDLLSATEWPGVSKEDVLLTPSQARTVWRQFSSDVALSVQQAVATQEANKLAQNKLPPLWAIIAMIFLGFNEFVAVLRNPLLLIFLILLFMFGRTVYNELEVESEMARGLLPGAMALSSKFMPVVSSVTLRTIEQARVMLAEGGNHHREPLDEVSDMTPSPSRGHNGSARVRFDTPEINNTADGGVRARKKDIELTPTTGTPVVGGDLLGGSRKDN